MQRADRVFMRLLGNLSRGAQSSKGVERLFWRLPCPWRRVIAKVCRIPSGVSPDLAAEILRRKMLFIHVPKTAGVSVQRSLFGRVLFFHQSFRQFELAFTGSQLASLFKFTFVRNPWDRLVSGWTFLREGGYGEQDRAWFATHLARFPDFQSFVLNWVSREDVQRAYVHFRPQVDFVRSGRGNLQMDFIGRFENLACDFDRLSRLVGCAVPLQSHNRTRQRSSASYRECYTPGTADVVARVYRDDIRTFGYEF